MKYTIQQVAGIIKAQVILADKQNVVRLDKAVIEHLLLDSRKIIYADTSLFFAIKGEHNDGHQYLGDAYQAGIRYFVIDREEVLDIKTLSALKDAVFLVVRNSLRSLQQLASQHRRRFDIPVIGITGSNGKTIVKEWLFQLLRKDLNVVKNPKSYNSQVGVPLSVWQMNDTHQLGIFEAGISKPGEMQHLQEIIQPGFGIFTFAGTAHDEGFKNNTQKLDEKMKLFSHSDGLVCCDEQEEVIKAVQRLQVTNTKLKVYRWSRQNRQADIFFETLVQQGFTQISTRTGSRIVSVRIPFVDEASVFNACTCFAFLICINRASTDTLSGFEELQPVEMRLQLKEGINNCIVINDSYNSDLQSLRIALDFMEQQSAGYKRTLILSDILETGNAGVDLYTSVARLIAEKQVDRLIGIGPALVSFAHLFKEGSVFYPDTHAFVKHFRSLDFNQEIVVLKGARKFAFEKISKLFERKVHETVFEINLNALAHNLHVYRSKVDKGVKMMGMVKAFSYGAGSYEIAKALEFHRVDYLTVAYADEGVVLRKAGIKLPIMVMNPEISSFDQLLQHNLEPEIYNFFILEELIRASNGEETGIHIEVDTGMKRLGFEEAHLDELISRLHQHPHIKVCSVFAHLAASEEKKHDEFTREQISRFARMSEKITAAFDYPVLRHILNSSGIVRFPEAHFDMVRLGIGLYGIDPSSKVQKQLQQIGTLKTVISQLRSIKAHETVGYSRRGVVNKDAMIATVAIGYADGYNRRLGNAKGYMLVNGKRAPVIGSVCMDMTMLDVTGIDCKEGDEVMVFGKDPDILDIADKVGTIAYEILTGISQRVKRIYYYE